MVLTFPSQSLEQRLTQRVGFPVYPGTSSQLDSWSLPLVRIFSPQGSEWRLLMLNF